MYPTLIRLFNQFEFVSHLRLGANRALRYTCGMFRDVETIAAIATAAGEAGISIVRVSGPHAFGIADQLFRGPAPAPSHRSHGTFVHGNVCHNNRILDDALFLIMRAPRSYTGEDTVEIHTHGGRVTAQRVLRATLECGAVMAQPGEFTKRAFLNGRLDLLQAEAVADLIHAHSERAAIAATEQLEGVVSDSISNIYDNILSVCRDMEALLDFAEEDIPGSILDTLIPRIMTATDGMNTLLEGWTEGRLLREGALVVISGPPNAGKSTLLNALLSRNRAIVSELPGTTRDSIEETIILDGIPLRLVDTAGLRETDCAVERQGIERTHQHIETARIHLHVLDASRTDYDHAFIHQLPRESTVLILNKNDLGAALTPDNFPDFTCVQTSFITDHAPPPAGEQADQAPHGAASSTEHVRSALRDKIEAGVDLSVPAHAVISERHRDLLLQARECLEYSRNLLDTNIEQNLDLAASHLRDALEALGQINGRVYHDELLDAIFSTFCVGK